jgi:hypothetical protein
MECNAFVVGLTWSYGIHMRNAYGILVGKSLGKWPLGVQKVRCENTARGNQKVRVHGEYIFFIQLSLLEATFSHSE